VSTKFSSDRTKARLLLNFPYNEQDHRQHYSIDLELIIMETVSSFTSRGYDFVIVGGGTAGLVLAVRLSENESITVSVIEAERDCSDDPKILTPGFCGTLSGDPDYDWKFMTTPQVRSLNS
jgi:hypothetical protein